MHGIIVLMGGFLLDCLLGDPHNPWHPICLIGHLISFLEKEKAFISEKPKRRAGRWNPACSVGSGDFYSSSYIDFNGGKAAPSVSGTCAGNDHVLSAVGGPFSER